MSASAIGVRLKPDTLRPGWALAELSEIAEVRLGRQRSPKNHTGVRMRPYLRAANVTWGGLDLSDVKEMNFTAAESETYELREGDVVVAEASGSASEVGKPAIWRGEIEGCCFQNTLIRVRTRHAPPEFLRYFVLSEARSGRIGDAAPGVGIHHIGSARLSAWPVPVPPLNEQRRIVAAIEEHLSRLDAADASLAAAARRLGLFRGAAVGEFLRGSWARVSLGEIADVITKGTTPTSIGHQYESEGILFVKAESLASGIIDHARCGRISRDADAALKRSRLADGDVLITIAGTLGRVGVVREVDLPANTNQAVSIVRLRDTSMTPWISAWLKGPVAQGQLTGGGRGIGLQNLNLKQIGEVTVPLPPLAEQRRIVAQVEEQLSAIDALRSAIERAQLRSQSLRRAVLERAFRGELVPQDPSDEPAEALLARIRADREESGPAPSR